ncbi:PIN domain-containing protein [Rubrivirga sp. IMCC45206]|uniref:PIN domain-containing protein n=1 Tax=Rubrivirga sp. IMCC45206 TaxID=3391614 RepID=UPI00398FF876
MTPRVALDSNVLIYAFDSGAPGKQARVHEILARFGGTGAVVPAQALAESSRVLLVKRRPPLTPDETAGYVRRLAAVFSVEPLTEAVVQEAIRGVDAHGLSYFDAQIWAAAKNAGAAVLLTEDFQDDQEVEGVRFVNPFAEAFDLAAL